MKKSKILSLISTCAAPALVILCGLVLTFSPDSASALVSRILSVILLVWGIGCALVALFGENNRAKNVLLAVALVCVSRWLDNNPLALAAGIGRFLGIVMMVGALGGFLRSSQSLSRVLCLAMGVLGLVLTVLPMTTSRLVFTLCGLAATAAGVLMLISRLREGKRLDSGDSNIIDAL